MAWKLHCATLSAIAKQPPAGKQVICMLMAHCCSHGRSHDELLDCSMTQFGCSNSHCLLPLKDCKQALQ